MTEIGSAQARAERDPREHAQAALGFLEQALSSSSEAASEGLGCAIEQLVAMRDGLIRRRRAGQASESRDPEPWLERTNAILSSVLGTEFPINGFRRDCVREAADALRDLIGRDSPGA